MRYDLSNTFLNLQLCIFCLNRMQIKVSTHVEQPYRSVAAGFTKELFVQLNPPVPPVKVLRFDGSQKGDEVHLELNFIFFKQVWVSYIVESGAVEGEVWFIDVGIKLPFFLKAWRHRHRIVSHPEEGSYIIDEIDYQSPFLLLDYLIYPLMQLQFLYRKPVYKRIFRAS
jgi:ligand-binding SRPBCC domain-containing protein